MVRIAALALVLACTPAHAQFKHYTVPQSEPAKPKSPIDATCAYLGMDTEWTAKGFFYGVDKIRRGVIVGPGFDAASYDEKLMFGKWVNCVLTNNDGTGRAIGFLDWRTLKRVGRWTGWTVELN